MYQTPKVLSFNAAELLGDAYGDSEAGQGSQVCDNSHDDSAGD